MSDRMRLTPRDQCGALCSIEVRLRGQIAEVRAASAMTVCIMRPTRCLVRTSSLPSPAAASFPSGNYSNDGLQIQHSLSYR